MSITREPHIWGRRIPSGILLFFFTASLFQPLGNAAAPADEVRSEVDLLRQERHAKMPYLDMGFIKSEIQPEQIQAKKAFLEGSQKRLDDLIERAIQVHTPARAARERVSLARRRILAAVRALFPEASLEFNEKEGILSGDSFNSLDYRFKFRQPLFRGGILWNTLLQEKAGLESAEKEYAAAIEDLVSEISAAYFEYNRAYEVVARQEKIVNDMKRFADISRKKFQGEIISEIEHLNVQSLYSQMQYDFQTSRQELELARLELQRYLGLEIEDDLTVEPLYSIDDLLARRAAEDKPATVAPQEKAGGKSKGKKKKADVEPSPGLEESGSGKDAELPPLAQLVDTAYLHRPEMQVEAAKLESARLEERIRWGKMIPQADAVLEFGKLGEAFDSQDITPSLRKEFRFMLEFNWNLGGNKVGYTFENDERAPSVSQFQGGSGTQTSRNTLTVGVLDSLQDFADAKEAEVSRLDQVTQLEKTEKEIIQDVKQSYFDYQKARIQVKSSLQRVDYRRRLSLLSKHKLEKNEIQISEYLQSEIDLLQELSTLHKALADYNTARVKLNHAVGIRNYFPIEDQDGRVSIPV